MVKMISLDLETWGTEPGCDIRSIGATVFDPVSGTIGNQQHEDLNIRVNSARRKGANLNEFYIACDNPCVRGPYKRHNGTPVKPVYKYPLTRDPRTVQWWSEQSDEAQAAFADPVDLAVALHEFVAWLSCITKADTDLHLWAHGPQFDISILAAAYRAVDLLVPWHYRAPRDTRTAFDMAGIDDHSAWLAQFSGEDRVQHHALSDAVCQARAVCAAWAVTRRWYLTSHEGFESELNNIAREIQDEGNRVYFGSTNDADLLREIAECKDANRFERDLSDSEGY